VHSSHIPRNRSRAASGVGLVEVADARLSGDELAELRNRARPRPPGEVLLVRSVARGTGAATRGFCEARADWSRRAAGGGAISRGGCVAGKCSASRGIPEHGIVTLSPIFEHGMLPEPAQATWASGAPCGREPSSSKSRISPGQQHLGKCESVDHGGDGQGEPSTDSIRSL
jgi:hypothetical protein